MKQNVRPESLLDDNGRAVAAFISLMFFVCPVSVLNDGRRLPAAPKPLLSVVATKLTLNEYCRLRHPLVVHELHTDTSLHCEMLYKNIKNNGKKSF